MNRPTIPPGQECAFPFAYQGPTTAPEVYYGMTLRDYFAAKAMQAILGQNESYRGAKLSVISAWAYAAADEMVKQREKK